MRAQVIKWLIQVHPALSESCGRFKVGYKHYEVGSMPFLLTIEYLVPAILTGIVKIFNMYMLDEWNNNLWYQSFYTFPKLLSLCSLFNLKYMHLYFSD